jgi:hypothetical protein
VLRPAGGGQAEEGLLVLSGVFTPTNGAWTLPVEIDAEGIPTMDNPANANSFKQGFNNYHSAKLGLYSEASGEMHEVLFGGISLQFLDDGNQVVTDQNMPFVNDVTSVVIDAAGNFSQHWLGRFPVLDDMGGKRLRYGANAEFFLAEGIETYENGVVKLDSLTGPASVGYIFGGLETNAPHIRGVPSARSAAANTFFRVVVVPIPEPATAMMVVCVVIALGLGRQRPAI